MMHKTIIFLLTLLLFCTTDATSQKHLKTPFYQDSIQIPPFVG